MELVLFLFVSYLKSDFLLIIIIIIIIIINIIITVLSF